MATDCALNSKCPLPGVAIEATKMTCSYLNLNCSYFWASDPEDYGRFVNGTWTGLLGDLIKDRFDASVPLFFPNEQRGEYIDFSNPYFYFDYLFVTRMPPDQAAPLDFGMLFAFEWRLWLCLSFCCICLGLTISILEKNEMSLNYRFIDFWQLITACGKAFQYLGGRDHQRRPFVRLRSNLLFTLWGIISVALCGTYTGTMFSKRLTNKNNPPYVDLSTFAQCLESQRCRLVATPFQNFIMERLFSAMAVSGSKTLITFDQIYQVNETSEVWKKILSDNDTYWTTVELRSIFNAYTNYNLGFQYYTLEAPFKDAGAFALPKGSRFLKQLNLASGLFTDNGMGLGLEKKYMRDAEMYRPIKDTKSLSPLTVDSVRSFYLFYGVGLGVAILVIVLELCYAKLLERRVVL